MMTTILVSLAILLAGFLIYVSTRPGYFNYERSGLLKATPAKIYPYISQLSLGGAWSPYEKRDPGMKKTFKGEDGKIGSLMIFDAKPGVGTGQIEILNLNPNESVEMKLIMTKPIKANHIIKYKLTPEGSATRFSWSMEGENGFMGKLMTTVINCEKMMGKDMNEGIENLKKVIE